MALFCASIVQAAPTDITSNLTPTDEVRQAPEYVNTGMFLKERTDIFVRRQKQVYEQFVSVPFYG